MLEEISKLTIRPQELSKQILKPEKVLEKEVQETQEVQTSKPELSKVLDALNAMPIFSDTLNFGFSEEDKLLLVQIRDKKTDDLIRQYPSEEFLSGLKYYRDNIGMLFDAVG